MTRARLPNRRPQTSMEVEFNGQTYIASVSNYLDERAAEIFISVVGGRMVGSAMEAIVRDLAVTASLALQYGCPVETLRAALTRLDRNEPSSPLGAALDQISKREGNAA